MTDKIKALNALLAKVEAGEWDWMIDWPDWDCMCVPPIGHCRRAYNGSLDAAKALHEEVLPGWNHIVCRDYVYVGSFQGKSDNPARAWLIAILKALIAEGASRDGATPIQTDDMI
jgi:hypothetical protein